MISIPMCLEIREKDKFKGVGSLPQMQDLVGGYSSSSWKSSMVIHQYRMLTSRESNHFNIRLTRKKVALNKLCDTKPLLQSESFLINRKLFQYIKDNLVRIRKMGYTLKSGVYSGPTTCQRLRGYSTVGERIRETLHDVRA